jgi:hypothetical protein
MDTLFKERLPGPFPDWRLTMTRNPDTSRAFSRGAQVLLTLGASAALVLGSALSASAISLPGIPAPPVVLPVVPALPVAMPTVTVPRVVLPAAPVIPIAPVLASVPTPSQSVTIDPGTVGSITVSSSPRATTGVGVSVSVAPSPTLANGLLGKSTTVAVTVPDVRLAVTSDLLKNSADILLQGTCGSVSVVGGATGALQSVVAAFNLFGLSLVEPAVSTGKALIGKAPVAGCSTTPLTPTNPTSPTSPTIPTTPTSPTIPGGPTSGTPTNPGNSSFSPTGYFTLASSHSSPGRYRSALASTGVSASPAAFVRKSASSPSASPLSSADPFWGALVVALLLILALATGLVIRHLRALSRARAL